MSDTQKHKKANVPNLRFPGFEGEWNREPLSSITTTRSKRIRVTNLAPTNYVSTENMLQDFSGISLSNCVPTSGNVTAYFKGDTLVSNIRPYLKKIWFADRDGGCSSDVLVINGNTKLDSSFLYYSLANERFVNHVMAGAKGVKMPRGDKGQMVKYTLCYPSLQEQQKITKVLSLIDSRIAIQSKVIDRLKMTELQIRESIFRGLSSPCVPLSSICIRIKERNDENNTNVLSISARDGLISQLDFFNKSVASENLSNYFLLRRGDFAYNKSYSSEHPWGAIKHLERYEKGVLSPLYICFRPNAKLVNSDFLQHYFETSLWHKYIAEIAVEGARNHGLLNMSIGDFFSMPIPLPSLEEQRAMAKRLSAFQRWKEIEESYYKTLLFQKQFFLKNLFI